VYLHDDCGSWGVDIFTITNHYIASSLFSITWRLPNGTDVRKFTIDDFDFLFLRRPLWKSYDRLSDSKLWGMELTRFAKFKLNILDKIFK
jgi:hypothetical protein